MEGCVKVSPVHLKEPLSGRFFSRLPDQITEVRTSHTVTARVGSHRGQIGVRGQPRPRARLERENES